MRRTNDFLPALSLVALIAGCGDSMLPGSSPDMTATPDLVRLDLTAAPKCTDGIKNGGETDVDCGGTCGKCGDGKDCGAPADCTSGVCAGGKCAAVSCSDMIKNGDESDVDCGGSCGKCGANRMCQKPADCGSSVCTSGLCADPSCTDTVKNSSESDVDCGGICPKCADGKMCNGGPDCTSGVCATTCQAPSCTDAVKNGGETDLDCGGPCPKCAPGKVCTQASDCASLVCAQGLCQVATCMDNVKNSSESDIDCGGTCPPCVVGKQCGSGADCASLVCSGGACVTPSCTDMTKNQDETDVDCGGSCMTKCGAGKVCKAGTDCASGICSSGTCTTASCGDMVKNGTETDVDCGGGTCPACDVGKVCGASADCKDVCEAQKCRAAQSCKELHAAQPSQKDGVYTIDPDKPGGDAPYKVFCDMTTDGGGWTQIEYLTVDLEGYKNAYAAVFSTTTLGTFGVGSYKTPALKLFNLSSDLRYSEPSTHITNPFTNSWLHDFKCQLNAGVKVNVNSPGNQNQMPAALNCINLKTSAFSANAKFLNYQQWSGCWTGPRLWIGSSATGPDYHGDYCVDCVVTWKCSDTTQGVYSTISATTFNGGSGAFWLR